MGSTQSDYNLVQGTLSKATPWSHPEGEVGQSFQGNWAGDFEQVIFISLTLLPHLEKGSW